MARSLRLLAVAGLVGLASPMFATAAVAAPTATSSAASASVTTTSSSASARHITIPKNYKYHPHSGTNRTLHDYCTKSPDAYRPLGRDADFRGPCARHDMCIQYKQHKRSTCDAYLLANLKSECRYTYSHSYDPRRGACLSTAYTYWLVVRVKTHFS